jgi:phosphatidylglycerophosphate synthase
VVEDYVFDFSELLVIAAVQRGPAYVVALIFKTEIAQSAYMSHSYPLV